MRFCCKASHVNWLTVRALVLEYSTISYLHAHISFAYLGKCGVKWSRYDTAVQVIPYSSTVSRIVKDEGRMKRWVKDYC